MLSGRSLCDVLITRPEESYRLWCVVVCDLETSRIGAPYIYIYIYIYYIYDISSLRVKLVLLLVLYKGLMMDLFNPKHVTKAYEGEYKLFRLMTYPFSLSGQVII